MTLLPLHSFIFKYIDFIHIIDTQFYAKVGVFKKKITNLFSKATNMCYCFHKV